MGISYQLSVVRQEVSMHWSTLAKKWFVVAQFIAPLIFGNLV